eukprot:5791832-Amphidinium_carterae.3
MTRACQSDPGTTLREDHIQRHPLATLDLHTTGRLLGCPFVAARQQTEPLQFTVIKHNGHTQATRVQLMTPFTPGHQGRVCSTWRRHNYHYKHQKFTV